MKPIRIPTLSSEQLDALEKAYRTTRNARLRTRAQIVLLAAQQRLTAAQIAEIVRASEETVRRWLKHLCGNRPAAGALFGGFLPRGLPSWNPGRDRDDGGAGGLTSGLPATRTPYRGTPRRNQLKEEYVPHIPVQVRILWTPSKDLRHERNLSGYYIL
jgi:hypothetical protein